MKHALLVWVLRALTRKPAPVFVLDTHAGTGAYALDGPAGRTGEWRAGIARLMDDPPEPLRDYVELVRAAGSWPRYPGSPALARAVLRPGDRLACCELHPEDAMTLRRRLARDPLVGVHHRDGWEALRGLLPPRERRGLVLIDPPFEAQDEFDRLVAGLRTGQARFRAGVFLAWYPVKHRAPVRRFHALMRDSGVRDIVAAELWLREPLDPARLNGCGLLVVNPPYRFAEAATPILAALLARLGNREPGEGTALERLADE
jgi:23S rRNA (adenine2030-N6)-methyltransferase